MVYRTVSFIAGNDAHIGLFKGPDMQGDMYEIVIGGWSNSQSVIRKESQGGNLVTVGGARCNPDEWVTVTVSIQNGNIIRVADGEDPNASIWMTYTDSDPHWKVNYIAVMTGWGADGKWIFQDVTEPRQISTLLRDDDQCIQERNGFSAGYTCEAHGPTYCNPAYGHKLNFDQCCPCTCNPEQCTTGANCQAWHDPDCNDGNCQYWAWQGECEANPDYMLQMCPFACRDRDTYVEENCNAWADEDCSDENCNLWAHMGQCEENPDYMIPMCPTACFDKPFRYEENCEAWDDNDCSDANCEAWANQGQCTSNYDYMEPMCGKTCLERRTPCAGKKKVLLEVEESTNDQVAALSKGIVPDEVARKMMLGHL